jgi:toxin CcdB
MARHDVFQTTDGAGYLLDVQSDLLDIIGTRVMVPLLARDKFTKTFSRLNPEFMVGDQRYVMMTQFITAVPLSILGPTVAKLGDQHDTITKALDMLFQGF